jgi:hypothetical protein
MGVSTDLVRMSMTNANLYAADTKRGSSDITSGNTTVSLGLRWVLGNFALDGIFSSSLLSKGPYMLTGIPGTGADAMLGQLGVSMAF